MASRNQIPLDAAEVDEYASADEGPSDQGRHSHFDQREVLNNSFSDVSLASGRSNSPVRSPSRLSRQSLAEHQAATNGHPSDAVSAIPAWSRNIQEDQQASSTGSLEEAIPEMLRIKDLDSGKEYNLDKVNTWLLAVLTPPVAHVNAAHSPQALCDWRHPT